MFRKLFILIMLFMFYLWATDSKKNVKKVKAACQYVIGKLNKMDLEINFPTKSKKRKW